MAKNEDKPMTKISLRVYTDDLEYLKAKFQIAGYNSAIRGIIRKTVKALTELDNRGVSEISDALEGITDEQLVE